MCEGFRAQVGERLRESETTSVRGTPTKLAAISCGSKPAQSQGTQQGGHSSSSSSSRDNSNNVHSKQPSSATVRFSLACWVFATDFCPIRAQDAQKLR